MIKYKNVKQQYPSLNAIVMFDFLLRLYVIIYPWFNLKRFQQHHSKDFLTHLCTAKHSCTDVTVFLHSLLCRKSPLSLFRSLHNAPLATYYKILPLVS